MPLVHLRGRISVAQQQQVDFVSRSAISHNGPDIQLGRRASIDSGIGRINRHRPHVMKFVRGPPVLDHEAYGRGRRWETDALMKRATQLFSLAGLLPFAENAGESTRIDQVLRSGIENLKAVWPEVGVVDPALER